MAWGWTKSTTTQTHIHTHPHSDCNNHVIYIFFYLFISSLAHKSPSNKIIIANNKLYVRKLLKNQKTQTAPASANARHFKDIYFSSSSRLTHFWQSCFITQTPDRCTIVYESRWRFKCALFATASRPQT